MKASVQYNDFKGTAAADISDHSDLKKFLESKGIDSKRFDPIGVKIYAGENNYFSASIICIDGSRSTDAKKHLVQITIEEISVKQFFDLFKRFEVIISKPAYQESKIDEDISEDDLGGQTEGN